MLDKRIRVLNFDNSIIGQSNLLNHYPAEIIDFTALASSARLYMSGALRRGILNSLVSKESNYPTFLGSGDFHHLSETLISRITEPVALIVFDFHPDWDIFSPRFSCGSWVATALKNKNISKCILIGAGSDDLSFPGLETAGLAALANNRLEIYPYRHKPSRVYLRGAPLNRSITIKGNFFIKEITWQELEKEDLTVFISKLIKSLPTKKAYISIDKDCLKKDVSLTNWEEGLLSLDQLLVMLRLIRRDLDIVGLDITGDHSVPKTSNRVKALISRLDHPREFSANSCSADLIRSVNEQTNLAILQEIFS